MFGPRRLVMFFFFFNDTATTEIYTLSLHDALPICSGGRLLVGQGQKSGVYHVLDARTGRIVWQTILNRASGEGGAGGQERSEEHTSELQSRQYLVCRLLLEKKKKYNTKLNNIYTSA